MNEGDPITALTQLRQDYDVLVARYRELAIAYTQLGGDLSALPAPPKRRPKSSTPLRVIKGGLAAIVTYAFLGGWRRRAVSVALAGASLTAGGTAAWMAAESSLPPAPTASFVPPVYLRPLPAGRPDRIGRHSPRRPPPRGVPSPTAVPRGGAPLPVTSPQPSPAPVPTPARPHPRPAGHGHRCTSRVRIGHAKVCVLPGGTVET